MQDNKQTLVDTPIPSLVRKIAIPASIGFFFNTMFNVVDTYFGGQLGTGALAALSASFPVFFLILAASTGISSASTSLIANSLGGNDKEKAGNYYIQSIVLGFLISIILSIIGFFIAPSLFRLMGVGNDYIGLSLSYMNVIFIGAPFFILASTLNSYLYALGNTKIFRNILIIGFFLNVLFDPWFMYGGFGIPSLGIAGLALATVLIQVIECIFLVWYLKHNHLLKLHKELWRPHLKTWKEIIAQALPSSINMMTVAIGIFILTYYVGKFGAEAIAAYGIAVRIEQIALLPSVGLNMAALSLSGQNNGAGRVDRIRETLRICLKYGFYTFLVGLIFIYLFGFKIMQKFTSDEAVLTIGINYLHIAIFVYMAYVILFVGTSTLQGLKRPSQALWISLVRQIILPFTIFTTTVSLFKMGLTSIWWGMFFINWSMAIVSLVVLNRNLKKREIEIAKYPQQ